MALIDWAFVLVPLLVLPIVLLFRYIGCGGEEFESERRTPAPTFRNYVLSDPNNPPNVAVPNPSVVPNAGDVIGYWRLIEPAQETIAADETNFKNGAYTTVATPLAEPLSQGNGGGTVAPSGTSLVKNEPAAICRHFDGGCVVINFQDGLFTPEFTIEAFVRPTSANEAQFEHTLFSAGGPAAPASPSGFSLFIDQFGRWAIRLGPAGDVSLGMVAPLAALDAIAHVAMTVRDDGTSKVVQLFVNGEDAGKASVPSYQLPSDVALFIAAANKADATGGSGLQVYRTFIGDVQEVVLHKKALFPEEVANHAWFRNTAP